MTQAQNIDWDVWALKTEAIDRETLGTTGACVFTVVMCEK